MNNHLVSLQDLDAEDILAILDDAAAYAEDPRRHGRPFADRIVCTAFFEPSTRTRLSFEAAAHRLGARVIGFSDGQATSAAKGESLQDAARVLSGYADALVLRHAETGAAKRAAAVASCPVINAGDGAGEHPTQTLTDLFTMRSELGRIEGLTVALVGDLRYGRTVHSLAPVLQRLGATVVQVPAPGLELPEGLTEAATMDLGEAAAKADVLYITRIQQERFPDAATYEAARGALHVDRALLETTRSKALVLHPLPRVDELATDVDVLPAAKYFDQARNGVPVRMAILAALLGDAA